MKLRLISCFSVICFLMIILQSASGGRAANGDIDATGSPGSSITCDNSYCHGTAVGTFTNPQIAVVVKNSLGAIVNAYVPGETYTLEFTSSSGGSPAGFGMQAVILDSTDNNAGDMLAVSTSNTQLTTIPNGREFVEHLGINSAGFFSATWQAPALGTGPVDIYAITLVSNGSGDNSGDAVSTPAQVTLSESTVNGFENIGEEWSDYEVYPMPNDGAFFIENKGRGGDMSIRILDLTGVVVYTNVRNVHSNEKIELKINDLVAGLYLIQIEKDGVVESKKLIVR